MARKQAKRAGKVAALKVRRMKLEDLVPADYNPRTITEDALAGLGRSVEEFGLVEPLVWNERTNRLVSGHQRLKVLARQGVDEVDVSVVDLDEVREKMLNVTLNNPVIRGEWAAEGLGVLLNDLKEVQSKSGLFGGLRLDELLDGIVVPAMSEPPEQFPTFDDDLETEYRCPKCEYEWSGKPK